MSKKEKFIYAKLIANPGAGDSNESSRKLELAARCLHKHGIKVDVALAKPKEEATPLAKQAVKDGYQVVIGMGGDGTIEAVALGLIGKKARLGIIAAGTANNMAKSLGIPEDLEEACALIATQNTRKLDIGQAKMKNGKKRYFFELTAIGLVSALYPDGHKVQDGKLSSLKDAALTLIHHESRPTVKLKLDDESKIKVETMLVVVSNTPVFGQNFLVAPNASLQDGLLDISVYPEFSKAELLAYYAKVLNEGFSSNEKIQRYRASKIEVKASPKLDVMADGVMLGKGTVEIKSRPKALWVIAPEPTPDSPGLEKEMDLELPPPIAPVPVEEKSYAHKA